MKRYFSYIIKIFLFAVITVVLYLIVIIGIGVATDYKPENITELEISGESERQRLVDSTFTFLSWNIGFCGLGAEMDFFYDGGKMVRPAPDLVEKYTNGVLDFLQSVDSIDFMILQEVDRKSARTGRQDELELIQNILPEFATSFGANYKVQFVPLPFVNPLGKVEMGQASISKYNPVNSQRYSFFSAYAWPKRLFMLDRCFVVSRFQMQNGKQLVLMNTHNSAYDAGGKLRDIEMPLIRDLMLNEFEKGNYVVAGGDWNQNPPDFNLVNVDNTYPAVKREILDKFLFPKDWQIVYDPENPTNREIDAPLMAGKTEVTIIDYFILSPNIQPEKIEVLSQNFQYSDHEPAFMRISLK